MFPTLEIHNPNATSKVSYAISNLTAFFGFSLWGDRHKDKRRNMRLRDKVLQDFTYPL